MGYALEVINEIIKEISSKLDELKNNNATQETELCTVINDMPYDANSECTKNTENLTNLIKQEFELKLTNVLWEGNLFIKKINLLINNAFDTKSRDYFLLDATYNQAVGCFQNNWFNLSPVRLYVQDLFVKKLYEIHPNDPNMFLSRRGYSLSNSSEVIISNAIGTFSKYKELEWAFEILLAFCKSVKIKLDLNISQKSDI